MFMPVSLFKCYSSRQIEGPIASRPTWFILSTLLWCWSCTQCILACLLWSKKHKHSSSNHALCCFNLYRPRLSLAETLIFCVILSQGLFVFLLSFKLLKAAKLFQIFSWFFSVTSSSVRFLRLNLSVSNFFVTSLLTDSPFPNFPLTVW